MSQPPPLPEDSQTNSEPIPVQPLYPQPIPAIPVTEYSPPNPYGTGRIYQPPQQWTAGQAYWGQRPSKPAIVSGLAITAIVLGCLGILGNGFAAFVSFIEQTQARGMAMMAGPIPLPSAPAPGAAVSAFGVTDAQRQLVDDAINNMHQLPPPRLKQLDALLSDQGKKIINLSDADFTPDRLATYVTSAKEMPSGDGPPDDVYMLASGRLQLNDSNAVFFPTGTMTGIRAGDDNPNNVAANVSPGGSALSQDQIQSVIDAITQKAGHAPNEAQTQSLKSALESQQQILFYIAPGVTASSQLTDAHYTTDQSLVFATASQTVTIPSAGGGTFTYNFAQNTPTNASSTASAPWLMADGIVSGLLAIMLLICGIFIMRSTRGMRVTSIIYCAIKLLSAVGLAIAVSATFGSNQIPLELWIAAGGIFPIVMIFLMMTSEVREYMKAPVAS